MKIKMNSSLRSLFGAMFSGIAFFSLATMPTQAAAVKVLQFTAGATNALITDNYIILDHPALNGKPGLKPIITQYWTGTYNNHPVALWYITGANAAAGRWSIYNDDQAAMPDGAAFNVLIPNNSFTPPLASRLDATPLNSAYSITAMSTEKGHPSAFIHFTHMWNPYPILGGIYCTNQSLGYSITSDPKSPLFNKWYIFNQDSSLPPPATSYFIFDATKLPAGSHAVNLVHTSNSGNSSGDSTEIDETGALTGTTNVVFITPINKTDNKPVGIYWDGNAWTIFNQDSSTFSLDQKFNILFFPSTN